ncbi:MAG: DUF998 domain-containing protein [Aestuariivirga sp.]|nr:DUF998 domain-containing protein [Aestuariivirga sp.]
MTTGLTADRALLFSGIAAGLLFFIVPTIEVFRRPGFDIQRHAISVLSLGEGGWIMKAVFIVCGILTLMCALGIYMELARGWVRFAAPLLIGAYGLGLMLAGLFDAPAGLGFPPGTPQDQAPVMMAGAILHSVAFMVAFSSLIASCFVFALYFLHAQQAIWAAISLVVGIALPALIGLGISMIIAPGIAFYWAAMLGWLWLATTVLVLTRTS